MQTVELVGLIAAGVAVLAVAISSWLLVRARARAREALEHAGKARELLGAVEQHAAQADEAAKTSQQHSERAWEQVKHASGQLEEARQEKQQTSQAEQWEWAYALTTASRELVDSGRELVRIALDPRVAPHYRLSADRHYRQSCQRWQDTLVKTLARTSPALETQHEMSTFAQVHQRLNGHIGVLLRTVETEGVSENDAVARQVTGTRQELDNAHRRLQRTISASLSTSGANGGGPPTQQIPGLDGGPHQAGAQQTGAQQATQFTAQPLTAGQAAGQPNGQRAAGQPAAGQQAAGQPAAAQPAPGQQPAGQQMTGPASGPQQIPAAQQGGAQATQVTRSGSLPGAQERG